MVLKKICFPLMGMLALLAAGCNNNDSDDPVNAVKISHINNTYYHVDIDLDRASRYQIGQEYATKIRDAAPDYEALMDGFLRQMIAALQSVDKNLNFQTLLKRAQGIFPQIPVDLQNEVQGMQAVFNYATDQIGDGRLSSNELLVLQVFGDALRASHCSASAVFGSASVSGSTIVGRNLDWYQQENPEVFKYHSVTRYSKGSKTIVSINILGFLFFGTGFNSDRVFSAVLDSDTDLNYPTDTTGLRSYMMDLRYAMENFNSIDGIANFFYDKRYAFQHLIFLADQTTSKVLEDDDSSAHRLRTAQSPLQQQIPPWNQTQAIAAVNSFMLVGSPNNFGEGGSNPPRWNSFISLYKGALAEGKKADLDTLKMISGYPGPDKAGNGETGALFRSTDGYPTIQSVVMRMDTLEVWAFFAPVVSQPVRTPTYIRVDW